MQKQVIKFTNRSPYPNSIFIGNEDDNHARRVQFVLPSEIDGAKIYLHLSIGEYSDVIELDDSLIYVPTRTHTQYPGNWTGYLEAHADNDTVWHSNTFTFKVGDLPDSGEQIEQAYPSAIESALNEIRSLSQETELNAQQVSQDKQNVELNAQQVSQDKQNVELNAQQVSQDKQNIEQQIVNINIEFNELKGDLVNTYKYKDDHPQYHFEQGTIRNTDGYIVKGNKTGIYTPTLIYLAKGTHITCPSLYTVAHYLWDNETYIGMFDSKIVAESGFYRICVRHSDATDISVDESNVLVIDEKPRIAKLESNVESLNVVSASVVENMDNMVVTGKNLLDTSKCIAYGTGNVNQNTGAIDIESGANYIYGMYNLEIGQDYVVSKDFSAMYVYFYNADNSYSGHGKQLTLGGGTKFKTFNAEYPKCVIVSLKDAAVQQIQLEKGTEPSFYVPFYKQLSHGIRIKDKTLYDKKVLIVGDSISTGDSSYAIHGIPKYGGYNKWVDDLISDGFFNGYSTRNDSIHATGYVAQFENRGNDYVSRLKAVLNPETYDYVFVTGCYNDWRHDVDLDSFKRAVDEFYEYLITTFTQAKILVMNSLKSFRCQFENTNGNYQYEYNDYIHEVARKYSLPFFDLYYDSGFCPEVSVYRNMWTYYAVAEGETEGVNDGVHPNEKWCREFMAPMIKHFAERYI